jgi:resuscitation-promoting factor RpfB
MKLKHGLVLLITFFLFACQPTSPSTVTILDKGQIILLQTEERVSSTLLSQAGITLDVNDRVLANGVPVAVDQALPQLPITLQIRRAVSVTVITSDGQQNVKTSAFTVGEMLKENSSWLRAGFEVQPRISSPIKDGMTVTISATQDLLISVDGRSLQTQSSARTVGEALAAAGTPLLSLDYSVPAENEPLPADGQIRVVRVSESLILAQKPIPFESDIVASTEIPIDQTQIIEPGETGLSMQRIRIRYEDGNEISRVTENETLVRPPKTRIFGYGTKIEIQTAVVDGVEIQYWRAMEMYATSYSPCRLGTGTCGSTTASGKQLRKGMVAVNRTLYFNMVGQPLFIPGYGHATIEDLCGGCVGKPWVDLGFTDENFEPWHQWVTVYFLTPVPSNVIYVIE